MSAHLTGGMALRVFACFASGYLMSYALRSVNAVIAPELVREFALSNAQLGTLSSAYFLAFAAMQLPLGVWLDRFGSRRTDSVLLLFAALGCVVFATAQGVAMLWIGRALIGLGVAGALMAPLRAFRFWYTSARQQQLVAWMLVAGTLGALSTTVPVQLALPSIGWRGVFWIGAVLLVASSAAIWTLLPRGEQAGNEDPGGAPLWLGYREVFASRYLWRFAAITLVIHAGFVSLQSLWAGPWFVTVLEMSPAQSAQTLFAFNLVLMLGFLGFGWVVPRIERRGWSVLQVVSVGTTLVLAVQFGIGLSSGAVAIALWLALAVLATHYTMMQTHVSLSFPEHLTGRAFTAYNLLMFIGIFVSQSLFGWIVDTARVFVETEAGAFRAAWMIWLVVQLLAFAVLLFWRVPPPTRREA